MRPGAATPLAPVNDADRAARLILDRRMKKAEIINGHPLHNEATLAISTGDPERAFEASGHDPLRADFDPRDADAIGAG